MTDIKKVVVLGSGVMGAGIAAHMANAGALVTLLDIVPDGASDRNMLAKGAIEKLKKARPAALTHPRFAKKITAGNLEDDLVAIGEADWIVEAVLEKIEIKHDVYAKIEAARKDGSVVSSNTSTLPLAALVQGTGERFQKDFMITHFFNPPRYMRLLELVVGDKTDAKQIARIREFADVNLGKGVVDCHDTPGFIANRIGCYWLMQGLLKAVEQGIAVEDADAVMGRPFGIPKTGVFGLFDLIGIDLMPLIAKALLHMLPGSDDFCQIYHEPEIVTQMIADGFTGRKGKGGFYMLDKSGGKKVKMAKNLQSGDYAKAGKSSLASVNAARASLAALMTYEDAGGDYARAVMLPTLAYTASLVSQIADDIHSIDAAMRMGYNWKYGPFELIDRMAVPGKGSGPQVFAELLTQAGIDVPDIVTAAGDKPFYAVLDGAPNYLTPKGDYTPEQVDTGKWKLAHVKQQGKPIAKNGSASLWDVGDGVACLEFTSKMNSIDPDILRMMHKSVEIVGNDYKALMIGTDADNFSVGANLGFFMFVANVAAWDMLDNVIVQGQGAVMALKYAPFPVVGALGGMALGGGCETLLHCDAVQAHIESYAGLVEVGVGVIPGWGGCKEMLVRGLAKPTFLEAAMAGKPLHTARGGGMMPTVSAAFENIALAKVGESAELVRDMGILRAGDGISFNRDRLLADAKDKALALVEGYAPPEAPVIHLPGEAGRTALDLAIDGFVASGKATPHDEVVVRELAQVLSGGSADVVDELSEQDLLDLERIHFMKLARTEGSMARIEHMLKTNKPLRN